MVHLWFKDTVRMSTASGTFAMTSTRWFSRLTMARSLFMIEVRGGAVW